MGALISACFSIFVVVGEQYNAEYSHGSAKATIRYDVVIFS
ncbi:hypothetical protein VCRA2121O68_20415 [Vibrio crassostreae]|uniref:Uncharacterized protein n=1 Tax=Vibrio crassostreae TaxID=246167 RepID=A0A822N5Y5_9VIBR|nr:hypothetical protein VCRA2118O41_10063 [Vibrio crassostreae]CAK1843012.1 hypothetical protein VCRA2119O46_10063 [Vibrio crassostreae]CAK1849457.1 hypothetical protein VCRA2117O37_10064 [Vibrio crassostreae]CAK1850159.1 hypothetical protein VCRA2116O31_10063 [Vibrio crassostreae]CAK2022564.1 hypothetical protein VCRA2113O20_20418 [Vibrio crassostreae]